MKQPQINAHEARDAGCATRLSFYVVFRTVLSAFIGGSR